MVESPIPQDILKYKGKFVGNLSTRETVCGALGVGMALGGYFIWFADVADDNVKMLLCSLICLPFFLVGFLKIYDQPFEKIAPTLIKENFIYPAKRKKEVHFPEFEKYEKTRYWLSEAEKAEEEEAGAEEESGKKGKKKKKPRQKISIRKSEIYKGIK